MVLIGQVLECGEKRPVLTTCDDAAHPLGARPGKIFQTSAQTAGRSGISQNERIFFSYKTDGYGYISSGTVLASRSLEKKLSSPKGIGI
jgi:hypothetical protein